MTEILTPAVNEPMPLSDVNLADLMFAELRRRRVLG